VGALALVLTGRVQWAFLHGRHSLESTEPTSL
jgi:hypothetical protein